MKFSVFVQEKGGELQLGSGPDLSVRGQPGAFLHVGPHSPHLQDGRSSPPAWRPPSCTGVTNTGPDSPPPLHARQEKSGAQSQVDRVFINFRCKIYGIKCNNVIIIIIININIISITVIVIIINEFCY